MIIKGEERPLERQNRNVLLTLKSHNQIQDRCEILIFHTFVIVLDEFKIVRKNWHYMPKLPL